MVEGRIVWIEILLNSVIRSKDHLILLFMDHRSLYRYQIFLYKALSRFRILLEI